MRNRLKLLEIYLHLVYIILYFFVFSYNLLYTTFCIFLITSIITSNNLHAKSIRLFLLLYYSISLIPGSLYRGETDFATLQLYTTMNFLASFALLFVAPVKKNIIAKKELIINKRVLAFFKLHLILVYISLVYVIYKHGFIIVNQDERFGLDATLGYIIKSTIYIPLIYYATKNKKDNFKSYFLYYFIPFFPALFIGSRGTVLMIIFGIVILKLLNDSFYLNRLSKKIQSNNKLILIWTGIIGLCITVGFFYIRRSSSTLFMSGEQLVNLYFTNPSFLTYIFAPLNFSLKEQIGITDVIIQKDLQNPLPYSIFFADMFTLLPGKQPSSGITLNIMVGNNDHAGLTPGILGALYLDVGRLSVFILPVIILITNTLYRKSFKSNPAKLYYVLTVIQLFHLFHRGFFKPEYLFSYFVLFVYFIAFTKKFES